MKKYEKNLLSSGMILIHLSIQLVRGNKSYDLWIILQLKVRKKSNPISKSKYLF